MASIKVEEDSNDSGRFSPGSISTDVLEDSSLITEEMVKEEVELENMALKKEEAEELLTTQSKVEDKDEIALKEKENCYKRLTHLLSRSKFYTSFLLKKLDDSKVKAEKKQKKQTATSSSSTSVEDTSNGRKVLSENVSNEQNSRRKRRRPEVSDVDETAKISKKRKKAPESYKISDILTKEAVEEAHRQHMENENLETEPNEPDVPDDVPEETRITSLGFTVSKTQPLLLEGAIMRDYQLKGLEWLKVLYEHGVSGILADEMGLGKTIQVISLISYLIEVRIPGPYLIVAPLSTLSNWLHEFERFAPQVPVVLFHGNAEQRSKLYRQLITPRKVSDQLTSVLPVVITSYEMPVKEVSVIRQITWQYIIVDEGHKIKNKDTRLSRTLTSCISKNRLLLTGTPLQNNLTELWSLLNFLLPELFDDISTFNTWLDLHKLDNADDAEKIIQKEKEEKLISTLHQILFPFLLRRTKADIILDFPPKKEVLVYCPMTEVQMEMYKFVVDQSIASASGIDHSDLPAKRTPVRSYKYYYSDNILENDEQNTPPPKESPKTPRKSIKKDFFDLRKLPKCKELTEKLSNGTEDGCETGFLERIKMQAPTIALQHIVNHPYIVRMPVKYIKNNKVIHVTDDLKKVSGKLLVLDAMLTKLKQKGHKVLLFSTSNMLLDIIEEYMILSNHLYVRLDGRSKLYDRKEDIYAFNTDPNIFVFLLSTRAGGLGINLTGADTVIIFNSDWNPMADIQAQDRAHRIGQTKPVVVYRFTVAGTIDEKVIQCANNKRTLEKIVMKSGAFKLNQQSILDLQELASLLKNTHVSKTVHPNGSVFSDEELEELLDRSDLIEQDLENKSKAATTSKKTTRNDATTVKQLFEVTKISK